MGEPIDPNSFLTRPGFIDGLPRAREIKACKAEIYTQAISPFQGSNRFDRLLPGATRFALAPGFHIPRLRRSNLYFGLLRQIFRSQVSLVWKVAQFCEETRGNQLSPTNVQRRERFTKMIRFT